MKKCIYLLICFLPVQIFYGQVVFCPPGSEWHYLQKASSTDITHPWDYKNMSVKYSHDSLLDGKIVKVVKHQIFFKENSWPCTITLFSQADDTVFMRNALTNHSWQVLYNFNAGPGNFWTNNFSGRTYTTSVLSTSVIADNGYSLKQSAIRQFCSTSQYHFDSYITERYGNNEFLFYFINRYDLGSADPMFNNMISEYLCYTDSAFGQKKFSTKPCDYENVVGLEGFKRVEYPVRVYPNPVVTELCLSAPLNQNQSLELVVFELSGNEVKRSTLTARFCADLSDLPGGIYFFQFLNEKAIVYSGKFSKQ